jgi:hypothetical protein
MTRLTITYGRRGGPRSGHIREGRRGVADPRFELTPGETPALRLNTDVGLRFQSDQLAKLPGNAEKLDYLKFEILGALDQFAQYQKAFLIRYFAFISARCQEAAPALSRTLDWSGRLFSPDDFAFSALWPLPDARVTQTDESGETVLGDFDFAFWTGRRAIGIRIAGGAAGTALGLKTAPGPVLPVTLAGGDLQSGEVLFVAPRFPDEFLSFWIGERVPCSPFRPVGLTDIEATSSQGVG